MTRISTLLVGAGLALIAVGPAAAAVADALPPPVALGVSREAGGPGRQAPPLDVAKLPKTFEAAAKAAAVKPDWTAAYKPKGPKDFTGLWINTGGIGWTPGIPPGAQQNPPLTPEYAAIFKKHLDNAAQGLPTGDLTASCLPQGMPRIMTMTYPMEIMMNAGQVNIYAEWGEQTRRVFTDGRPLDPEPDPTFYGQSVGHWDGDVLVATTFGLRPDTNLEASGLPHSEQLIVYERMWLADDDTFKDEITLVDPKAYLRPWTVTKTFKRAEPGFRLMPYVCLENNRNPVAADGSIQTILKSGD